MLKLKPQPQQDPLLEDPRFDVGVPDGSEQNRVELAQRICSGIGQYLAGGQVPVAAPVERLPLQLEVELGSGSVEDFLGFESDLGSRAVSAEKGKLVGLGHGTFFAPEAR